MQQNEIPIISASYQLISSFYSLHSRVSKAARYTLWQRCENLGIDVLEQCIRAGHGLPSDRHVILSAASVSLDLLRVLLRLCQDSRVIDRKAYINIQQQLDSIGRMLGGWIKSTQNAQIKK